MPGPTKRGSVSAEAFIRRNEVIIRLPIEVIPAAVSGAADLGYIPAGWKVTDAPAFAREVVRELNRENPDNGTTPVHRLFDAAFLQAFEQGAEGTEDEAICDDCGMPDRSCGCSSRKEG